MCVAYTKVWVTGHLYVIMYDANAINKQETDFMTQQYTNNVSHYFDKQHMSFFLNQTFVLF